MEKSDSIKALVTALVKAQAAMTPAKKDAANPFFSSHYASLSAVIDAVKKPLEDNGLCYIQGTEVDPTGGVIVETMLAHITGEWIASKLRMKPVKDDPQGVGSCLSYAKRYGLQAIVGLPTEDDDGNAASKAAEGHTSAPQTPRKPEQPKPALTGGGEGKKPQEALMDELMAYCEATGLDPERVLYDVSNFEDSKNKGKFHYLEIDKVAKTSDRWAGSALKNLRLLVKKQKDKIVDEGDIPF